MKNWLLHCDFINFSQQIHGQRLRILVCPADLVTFTEEILNRKFHFLCNIPPMTTFELLSFSYQSPGLWLHVFANYCLDEWQWNTTEKDYCTKMPSILAAKAIVSIRISLETLSDSLTPRVGLIEHRSTISRSRNSSAAVSSQVPTNG